MTSPDLSDPDVRELLDRNHRPEEITVRRMEGGTATVAIACEKCGEPYPCPTRLALRERERDLKRRQLHQAMKLNPERKCPDMFPHGEHVYLSLPRAFYCPGTDYQYVDCDDVPNTSHQAHAWSIRGSNDFWCSGG